MRLRRNGQSARDRSGIPAEQNADLVLGLLDRLLQSNDLRLGLLQQYLCLQFIGYRGVSTLKFYGGELHHILIRSDCLFRNLELGVKFPQRKIVVRHAGNQSHENYLLSELSSQQIRACRLGRPPILAPEIEDPGCLNANRAESRVSLERLCTRIPKGPAQINLRKLIRPSNPQNSARLQDAGGG